MLLGLISLFLAGVVSSIPLVIYLRWRRTWKNNPMFFGLVFMAASMVLIVGFMFLLSVLEVWWELQNTGVRFWGLLAYISSFFISVRLFGDPGYRQPTQENESRLVPMGEGKDCWFCKNEIPSLVKTCPSCHTYQSRWTLGFQPIGMAFVILLFAAGPFTRWYLEGASFQAHVSQVRVVSSTVEFLGDDETTLVFVLGRLQNDSDVTWMYVELEVSFFSKEGTLVDTISSDASGLQLMPHAEAKFRVIQEVVRPEEDYFRHEVIVKDAMDKGSVPLWLQLTLPLPPLLTLL